MSFQQASQRICGTPYSKDNPKEEIKVHQEQVYEVQQESYSLTLLLTNMTKVLKSTY